MVQMHGSLLSVAGVTLAYFSILYSTKAVAGPHLCHQPWTRPGSLGEYAVSQDFVYIQGINLIIITKLYFLIIGCGEITSLFST